MVQSQAALYGELVGLEGFFLCDILQWIYINTKKGLNYSPGGKKEILFPHLNGSKRHNFPEMCYE